ncbi:MAG: hypothetical protein E7411_06740 [Ruminococcaceae bacterium]|nr:hypothetical protein [Oscillospiraceae bacterium]
MIFEINQIVVDIDVEATRSYYTQVDRLNDCSCSGCVNYRQYTKECNNKIKDFFSGIGIDDMNFITEITPLDVTCDAYEQDHCIDYMGFYHIKGEIIENKQSPLSQQECIIQDNWEKIDENFYVTIHNEISFLPDGFPTPCLQLGIFAHFPWVIEEENTYIFSTKNKSKKFGIITKLKNIFLGISKK